MSNETGTYKVYMESFPSTGFRRQISTLGGFEPHWRGDGKELFYLAPNQTLMAVGVKSTPTPWRSAPRRRSLPLTSSGSRFRRWPTTMPPLPTVNAS